MAANNYSQEVLVCHEQPLLLAQTLGRRMPETKVRINDFNIALLSNTLLLWHSVGRILS
jgi:hypothetical protein